MRVPSHYYYYCLWGSIVSTTCSNVTEVAKWPTPSFSRPQPVTENVVDFSIYADAF